MRVWPRQLGHRHRTCRNILIGKLFINTDLIGIRHECVGMSPGCQLTCLHCQARSAPPSPPPPRSYVPGPQYSPTLEFSRPERVLQDISLWLIKDFRNLSANTRFMRFTTQHRKHNSNLSLIGIKTLRKIFLSPKYLKL